MPEREKRDSTAWWGETGRESNRPSLIAMLKNKTLDLRLAAMLWLFFDRRASVIFASAPDSTGRTAMLSALIDFIPQEFQVHYVYGPEFDEKRLPEDSVPESTYLLVPELSPDRDSYMWGKHVARLFRAVERGYAIGTTMHADSPEQVVRELNRTPNRVPRRLIGGVDVVVNLKTVPGGRSAARRVAQVTLLIPRPDDEPEQLTLAGWETDAESYLFLDSPSTIGALAQQLGITVDKLDAELTRMRRRLEAWQSIGTTTANDVRKAVDRYHQTRRESAALPE